MSFCSEVFKRKYYSTGLKKEILISGMLQRQGWPGLEGTGDLDVIEKAIRREEVLILLPSSRYKAALTYRFKEDPSRSIRRWGGEKRPISVIME